MAPVQKKLPDPVFVTIDDARIATYELGPDRPDGAVVLCHGTPWSAEVWAEVAHTLSARHRVLLWDMPGYGRSSMDAAVPVDLASQMSRFARLLDLWGLRSPHVVAHDIGDAVALGAHLLHNAEYADLFLWDVVTLDPWGSPFFRLVAEHAEVFSALPPNLHAALVEEYIAGAARHGLPHARVEALASPWTGGVGQPAFYRQIAALRPEHTRPVADRLDLVRCVTRIGWGREDPWVPVEQAQRLQALLPGDPTVIELAGVGHLAPMEDAATVSAEIEAWLTASGID